MREWRACDVGRENAERFFRFLGLDEPDKAGPEHGFGSSEKRLAERIERGECVIYKGQKLGWRSGERVGGHVEPIEEEMVVESHGGNIEGVGLYW